MSLLPRLASRYLPGRAFPAVIAALMMARPVWAAEPDPGKLLDAIQHQVSAIYESSRGAVVRIQATDRHGRLSGTGFFIDPNGTIYTSYTVGGESEDIVVTVGGKSFPATRLISDLRSGIAILKISAETPFLTLGKSSELGIASPIVTVGYPMDLPLTPTFGTVGGFDIMYMGRYFATTHIRANIAAQRGEGGAPLLDLKGAVVGILISRLDSSGGASFALPIEAAEKVRKDFLRFHQVRPGWIGVHIQGSSEASGGSSVVIDEVLPDSPASSAGVQPGDILLQLGSRKIIHPEDVLDAVFYITAEDDLLMRVARNGTELEIHVRPLDPPESGHPKIPSLGVSAEATPAPLKIGGN